LAALGVQAVTAAVPLLAPGGQATNWLHFKDGIFTGVDGTP